MTTFEGKIKELSRLIRNWNLPGVQDKVSIEAFAKKILFALDKECDAGKIQRIIESDLCVKFGLFNYEFDAVKLSNNIMQWWSP